MRVQIFYFDDCPHWESTEALVRRVASSQSVDAQIERVRVESPEDARHHRFLGSPTVRIDGVDIDPSARARADFTLGCRLYGTSGVPTLDLVVRAFREAGA